ncbi:MAG TPA: Fur family transcriptional regulator [Mariniphaga sp.]|nr:Fur family transcriptional regulator [Mariniphaga sp.]
MDTELLRNMLKEKNLKVTPQRMAILEAIMNVKNHPSAENVVDYIRKNHPNISVATVYKVLDVLVENHLIGRVKTDKDVMRYDAILESHHHLYCSDSDKIEDYFDDDLNHILKEYFKKKEIPNFEVEDIKLQIIGRYNT